MGDKPTALQLCPFSSYFEAELARRFILVRWFELSQSDREAWLREKASEVRAIVTGGHIGCSNDLIDSLPTLGIIAINGVGYDKVDLEHAASREVRVTTTPGVLTEDVADLAIGLVISLLRQIPAAHEFLRSGGWQSGNMPLAHKVTGRTFGIVGMGQIGTAIADRLKAFGKVQYTDMAEKPVEHIYHASVLDLAKASDILIVASTANESTHHLVGASVLEALGPSGYLVNVSRGSIVNEADLIDALRSDRIAGAGLDVFEDEPNVPDSLRTDSRVVLTPHIASATEETRKDMADLVLANVDAYLAGHAPPSAIV